MSEPSSAEYVKKALSAYVDPAKRQRLPRYFQAHLGGYGEGDQFLGVSVSNQRKVAASFKDLPLPELETLLTSAVHEHRLTALIILCTRYQTGDAGRRRECFDCYMRNIRSVNNWDLVDSSAPIILGDWYRKRSRQPLYELAESESLWQVRIAVLATLTFVREGDFQPTLDLARRLLNHPHDLIHKAVGWMLREIGRRDESVLRGFLDEHAAEMPRTMLRYSVEQLSKAGRSRYMDPGSVSGSA